MVSNQGDKDYEVFEPLGLRSNKSLLEKYFPFKSVEINDYPVQKTDSTSCGKFCIFYICNRYYNGKLNIFQNISLNSFSDQEHFQRTWTLNSLWTHFLMLKTVYKMKPLLKSL